MWTIEHYIGYHNPIYLTSHQYYFKFNKHQLCGGGYFFLFGVFVTTPPVGKSDVASIIDVMKILGMKLMMYTTDKSRNPVGGNEETI